MKTDEDRHHSLRRVDPDRWVDDHGDALYHYALLRVRTPQVAEDLVQETFLGAIRSLETFAHRSSEKSWLFGILKYKIADHYRKIGAEVCFTDIEFCHDEFPEKFAPEGDWIHVNGPRKWEPGVEEVMRRNEFWQTMGACLGKLPQRVADVFMLREMDDVSSKDICVRL